MSMPILYEKMETQFASNGIGMLPDCIRCTVQEERNGQFELELEYPMTGALYSEIKNDRILRVKANEKSGTQTFRIYKVSKPIGGIVTVYAQHISYQLKYITVSPTSATQCAAALNALKAAACEPCPFIFWTDVATVGNFVSVKPSSLRGLLGGQDGSVLDVYGGEYEFDNYAVKLWANRGQDTGVRIEYGKNLTDLKQEEYISELCTGVHPFWADSDGNCTELPEKTIQLQNEYSFPRVKTLDLSSEFQDKPGESELRKKAKEYIQTTGLASPKVGIDLSFLPLWQTDEYKNDPLYKQIAGIEKLGLCDTVTVRYAKLGVEAKAKITGYVYDCLLERYDRMSIGSVSAGLSETIAKIQISKKNEQSRIGQEIRAAQDHLQKLITGATGGHIVIKFGDDGQTAELLCMDTADKATCKDCIRLNKAGMGFSQNGYNGPFNTAIGIDGGLFSQWIATWQLTADIIKAGVLQSANGDSFYLDLETGKLRINTPDIKIGGVPAASKDYADTAAGKAKDDATADADAKFAEFSLTIDGMSSTISAQKTELQGYADTAASNAHLAADADTANALKNYSTITAMETAIKQSADSVTIEASKTYATKDSLGNYTKTDEVRSKWAMDATSVTVSSGNISFSGNTITISSDHFSLSGNGSVSADGSFRSYDSKTIMQSELSGGHFYIDYKESGAWKRTVTLSADPYIGGLYFPRKGDGVGLRYILDDGLTLQSYNQKLTFAASAENDYKMLFGVADSRWTLCPTNGGYISLGTPDKPWADVFCNNIYVLSDNGDKKRGVWRWQATLNATVLCME